MRLRVFDRCPVLHLRDELLDDSVRQSGRHVGRVEAQETGSLMQSVAKRRGHAQRLNVETGQRRGGAGRAAGRQTETDTQHNQLASSQGDRAHRWPGLANASAVFVPLPRLASPVRPCPRCDPNHSCQRVVVDENHGSLCHLVDGHHAASVLDALDDLDGLGRHLEVAHALRHQSRLCVARVEGVDAHALARQMRQRARESDQSVLARGVERVGSLRHQAQEGGDVDDHTAGGSVRLHRLVRKTSAVDACNQIDVH